MDKELNRKRKSEIVQLTRAHEPGHEPGREYDGPATGPVLQDPHRPVGMPEGVRIHNACNEPCDAGWGPCACGAWHTVEDWVWRVRHGGVSARDADRIISYIWAKQAEAKR